MGTAPVWRGRSNHAAAQSRLAAHGARRCEQQAGCAGAPGRATAGNVLRSRLARRCPKAGMGLSDRTGSQNATRSARSVWRLELYFETKHNCTENCIVGSMAWAGSEAGSGRRRPAAGRHSRKGSENRGFRHRWRLEVTGGPGLDRDDSSSNRRSRRATQGQWKGGSRE